MKNIILCIFFTLFCLASAEKRLTKVYFTKCFKNICNNTGHGTFCVASFYSIFKLSDDHGYNMPTSQTGIINYTVPCTTGRGCCYDKSTACFKQYFNSNDLTVTFNSAEFTKTCDNDSDSFKGVKKMPDGYVCQQHEFSHWF